MDRQVVQEDLVALGEIMYLPKGGVLFRDPVSQWKKAFPQGSYLLIPPCIGMGKPPLWSYGQTYFRVSAGRVMQAFFRWRVLWAILVSVTSAQ